MYYLDQQRSVTRRDSSLITSKRYEDDGDTWFNYQATDSAVNMTNRPKVENELVTLMFESMLNCIVESWEVIAPQQQQDMSYINLEFGRIASDAFSITPGKKKKLVGKGSKIKRSRSKIEGDESQAPITWWSAPDEKAIIRFRNGNLYEGHISMKCMHGEGRFQWRDGTVYLGQFKDNEMEGNGLIQWKDDTWYQGEFAANMRHGHGLYVDSRLQRSYTGDWDYGTKHGQGVIYYTRTFKNSYDGYWIHNERFGYGSREYSASSGYKGEWERNIREGEGLMIWPNNDCYRGYWKNGVMSGCGVYIWDSCYNNSMSLPSLKAYRGFWVKGQRNGYGILNFGSGYGSFYQGDFKNNKKHGAGQLVTNSGLILQDKQLFIDDNMGPLLLIDDSSINIFPNKFSPAEPFHFDFCDSTVGLSYHILQALQNIDKTKEVTANIINEYIQNNKPDLEPVEKDDQEKNEQDYLKDLIMFEEISLHSAIRCYEIELRNIYYKYATICNTDEINFTPVMIRLYLWQLYNDCNLHEKGLTLCDIDEMFYENREWLSKNRHDPFEKIYFWQYLHSLITVASKLYAKRNMPGPRPDTILASGFRAFMEQVILPGSKQHKGRLVSGFGEFIPLKAVYTLYQLIGEPHTIRTFLRAVQLSTHLLNPNLPMVEAPDESVPWGRNVYVFADEISFTVDDDLPEKLMKVKQYDLYLFNFANLTCKTIIGIFAKIFPQVIKQGKVMDLNIKLSFYEFFEAFCECTIESIRVKEEEIKWRAKFSFTGTLTAPRSSPTGYEHGHKT